MNESLLSNKNNIYSNIKRYNININKIKRNDNICKIPINNCIKTTDNIQNTNTLNLKSSKKIKLSSMSNSFKDVYNKYKKQYILNANALSDNIKLTNNIKQSKINKFNNYRFEIYNFFQDEELAAAISYLKSNKLNYENESCYNNKCNHSINKLNNNNDDFYENEVFKKIKSYINKKYINKVKETNKFLDLNKNNNVTNNDVCKTYDTLKDYKSLNKSIRLKSIDNYNKDLINLKFNCLFTKDKLLNSKNKSSVLNKLNYIKDDCKIIINNSCKNMKMLNKHNSIKKNYSNYNKYNLLAKSIVNKS